MQQSCHRFWQRIVAPLVLASLAACAGSSPPEHVPTPTLGLPSPVELPGRELAFAEGGLEREGNLHEATLPFQHVSAVIDDLLYSPTGDDAAGCAYAVYAFGVEGYDRDELLRLTWTTPPAPGRVWVGLANFSTNSWDWFQAPASQVVSFNSLAQDYTGPAPDFNLYAVVLVRGTTELTLDKLRVGSPPGTAPTADLQATPLSGAAPLVVDFDASGSTAVAPASITKYEYNFGEGAGFEDMGMQDAVQHTYADPGSYTAVVRVNDSNNATDVAQVLIQATGGGGSYEEVEDNDRPDEGNALTLPLTDFHGSIGWDPSENGYDGDIEDYFTFDAAQGETVDITLTYQPTLTWANLVLAAEGDLFLAYTDGGNGDSQHIHYTFGPADPVGPYYIYVYSTEGYSDYTLDIALNNPTARLSSSVHNGSAPLDVALDAVASSAVAPATIESYEFDPEGDGSFLAGSVVPTLNHQYAAAGVYRPVVQVTDDGGRVHTAQSLVTVDTAYSESEPNDMPMEANPIGAFPATLRANYSAASTYDVYSFNATDGQTVTVELSFGMDYMGSGLGLYFGDATAAYSGSQNQNGRAVASYVIGSNWRDVGGPYYILVMDYMSIFDFDGDYVLNVTLN